jgi:hypothetical protein
MPLRSAPRTVKSSASFYLPDGCTLDVGAKAYRTPEDSRVIFPFLPLDPVPGGSNLGRIEWSVEFVKGKRRNRLGALALWARQTRDPQYDKKVFLLDAGHCPCITTRLSGREDFTRFVWNIARCEMHGHLILTAYPADYHRVLIVDLASSISGSIYFAAEARPA